jgi:hypothetical protein
MLSEQHVDPVCVDCGHPHDLDRPCPEPGSRPSRAELSLVGERDSSALDPSRLLRG